MNCRFNEFDLNKTWIILTAGKKDSEDSNTDLERRILKSLISYIRQNDPTGLENVYGRAADILLHADDLAILDIPGIGIKSRARIRDIRAYLNERNLYRWIFDKSNTIHGCKKEVDILASFGDAKETCTDEKFDKEYSVEVNGHKASVFGTTYATEKYRINLSKEEYQGIQKLFDVVEKSGLNYITGMGVYEVKNV